MEIKAFNHIFIPLLLLLLLLSSYVTLAYHDDTHNVAKRLDVDVCTDNFKIHQSTIIRTEESKAMGARFINDEEVASNDACMRLCCADDECDVFIFEEKTSGTCFLFHCGLPDDFRCKFTGHSNYTSGILTSSRSDLQSASVIKPKLSQNELELVNLKRPSSAYHMSSEVAVQPVTTSTIPPLGIRLADVTSTQTTTKSPTATACGKFQFQCQTSKECIAIYNVCDQIAQCEDGSDEGPECPANGVATVKTMLTGVENQQPKLLDNQISRNRVVSPVNMNDNNFNQMPRPLVHNREDPMSAPKYPQQSHVAQYMDTDTESRIFNHKNNILTNSNNFPVQYPHNPYNMMPQQQQQMPPQLVDDQIYRNDWPQMPQQQQQLQQPVMPAVPKQSNVVVWPEKLSKQSDEKVTSRKKEAQHKDSDYSEEYADGDESQPDGDDVTTTEAPKKRKHKKVKGQKKEKSREKPLHEQLKQLKSDANDDEQFIHEHKGHVEKPTGAILSLTLGCLVLAALSVVIGCRMRRVNVRRRRHGKAVDADFLVNGMYL